MVSLVDAQQYPPPTDLQTDAVRLCITFQSQLNPEFLGAATELLSCVPTLSHAEFHKHSRKFRPWQKKTARDTLEASGISLYLFTAASCQKGKWKDVYFDLLRMLQTRRADVDDSLRVRGGIVQLACTNIVTRQIEEVVGPGDYYLSRRLPAPSAAILPAREADQPTIAISGTPRSYVLLETYETLHSAGK
ncbi:hypothetical protein B0H14DRAFT_2563575 [Mycena olivaceomarginata]|nr:hypothetical protein B0H14DRAFT_2563575 [Mycena olivaceomarginata]